MSGCSRTLIWCSINIIKYMKLSGAPLISSIFAFHYFLYHTSSPTLLPLSRLISSPPSWPPWRQTVSLWCTTLGIHILRLSSSESKAGSSHDWWANGILIQLLSRHPVAISTCQPSLFGNLLYWEQWGTRSQFFTQLAVLLLWSFRLLI